MEHRTGREVCDRCSDFDEPIFREFHSLASEVGVNEIVWYECGHVVIVKDGLVEQEFEY